MTQNTTILVLEDFGQLRRRAASILGQVGYSVLQAASAGSALELLLGGTPIDLLVVDAVLLERPDASALLRETTRRRPGLSVLLTSSFNRSADPPPEGFDSYFFLAKPYSKTELIDAVAQATGRAVSDSRARRGQA